MGKIFKALRKPWLLSLLALVLLSLVIWFVGPLVAIADKVLLASAQSRLLLIMVALLCWGLNNLRLRQQDTKASQALTEGLQADAAAQPETRSKVNPDEQMLHQRLQDSLALLKGSAFEREGKLYKLPWYIIIGAPGSGKTTAIQNSGLQFPLSDAIGNEPIKGEGGTRYCDWWFTDEAILIDTAGRYTTQDNPAQVESSAWLGFLSRIKKARPKRPLNGIIVTISVQDVLAKTATQKSLQITAIKQRIQELNNHLQMQLPVYVLFSKMDKVAGFGSFFSDMEKQDRSQIWGFSAPARPSTDIDAWFEQEFSQLVAQLYGQVNHRLNRETSQQKRCLVSEFPRQMQALRGLLQEYVSSIFSTNQFESPLLLRGVFFISGTQTDTVSQWVTSLAPVELMAPPVDHTGQDTKPYFVQNLLKNFIFAESNVATVNQRVTQRFRVAYSALLLASLGGFAGGLFAWTNSKNLNEQYLDQSDQAIDLYYESTNGGLDKPHSWSVLNEGLNLLKHLPTGFEEKDSLYTWPQGFGLYQGDKIGAQAQTTYVEGLSAFFMDDFSRLLLEQIAESFDDDERLYEALKFYLMLYQPEHLEQDSLLAWAQVLWQRSLPGEHHQALRDQLGEHLITALEQGALPTDFDEHAVATAREALVATPLDMRAYRRIKNDHLANHPEQFNVQGVLGKRAKQLFTRRSGLPLSQGVPAFFTYEGFHAGFNVASVNLAKKLADEQWIYGDTLAKSISDTDLEEIKSSVYQQYLYEYQTRWDYFLNDLSLLPFGTVTRGKTVVRLLASADEPLIMLLKAIRKHTALAEAPGVDKETVQALGRVAENVASSQKSRLERLVPTELIAKKAKLPGQDIDRYFSELNSYTAEDGSAALLSLQEAIYGLNNYLQKLLYAEDLGQAAFASTSGGTQKQALMQLQISVDEAPPQLQGWFQSLGKNTQKVAQVATQSHINTSWQSDVLAFYEQHLQGRYPLDKTSQEDIKLTDFVAFFGPGGVLDSYFKQYLAPYVDTRSQPWRWRKPTGMSAKVLEFFQRADSVRQAFFAGSENLNVAFSLKPHTLDRIASNLSLDISGANLNYHHGPPKSQSFQWPGEDPSDNQLSFSLVSRGTPISVRGDGDWGWFRLLDQYASFDAGAEPGTVMLTFAVNGIETTQELHPSTRVHPFDPALMSELSLPERL
ncbi:type VI secretion system membrane subunit TssM [Halioxenophilus aromaticivorans]|uniref:Type VI secretion system membrane subunit TssM n=1 Tax=Halioxenophilus aromaticivorans TaxID=1306992 RepID=A0AAV3U4E0_9ALTE